MHLFLLTGRKMGWEWGQNLPLSSRFGVQLVKIYILEQAWRKRLGWKMNSRISVGIKDLNINEFACRCSVKPWQDNAAKKGCIVSFGGGLILKHRPWIQATPTPSLNATDKIIYHFTDSDKTPTMPWKLLINHILQLIFLSFYFYKLHFRYWSSL